MSNNYESPYELPAHIRALNPDLFPQDQAEERPLFDPEAEAAQAMLQYKNKQAQAAGASGEETADQLLRDLGVRMVADIATPITVVAKHPKDPGYVRIAYKEKVAGDINGIMGDGSGRRVLAEVKNYKTPKLGINRLTENQQNRLQENHDLGGISLVIWLAPHGSYVLRWPILGWINRKPLTQARALQNIWDGKS